MSIGYRAADNRSVPGERLAIAALPRLAKIRHTGKTPHNTETDLPDIDTVRGWQRAILVGSDGDEIGDIDAIYVDDQTGEPEWALVNTGFFGTKSSFVPLAQASASGDQAQVPYDKQLAGRAGRQRRC